MTIVSMSMLGALLLVIEAYGLIKKRDDKKFKDLVEIAGADRLKKAQRILLFTSVFLISIFLIISFLILDSLIILVLGIVAIISVIIHQSVMYYRLQKDVQNRPTVTKVIKSFCVNVFVLTSLAMIFF